MHDANLSQRAEERRVLVEDLGGLGCIKSGAQYTSCSQDNCHSKDSSTYICSL